MDIGRLRYGSGVLAKCPKCGSTGRLYYINGRWVIRHGGNRTHYINSSEPIEVEYKKITTVQYFGGDYYLIPYLVKMIPPHKVYVEVFGGSGKLLLFKSPSNIEVYNDIDGDIVNIYRTIRDHPDEVIAELMTIPYSRRMYYEALIELKTERDKIRRAALYIFILQASFSGRVTGTGFGTSKKGNRATKYSKIIDAIRPLHERLKNVVIEDLDFRECIKKYDSKVTFFYLDPPHLYMATEKGGYYYKENMTDRDYMDLIQLLERIQGKFLLRQANPPGFILEWARRNKYHTKRVSIRTTAPNKNNSKEQKHTVVFIANYKI